MGQRQLGLSPREQDSDPLLDEEPAETHLDLVHTQTVHPGHESGQGGFSRSTDPNQKQVALRLAEYSETVPERICFKALRCIPLLKLVFWTFLGFTLQHF